MRTEIPGYVLDAVIGVGASATVYRGRQLRAGGRVVAVKRLRGTDAEFVAQLEREGEILAQLDHPNILRLFELVRVGDGIAIVLQHAGGGSLADLLARCGRLESADTAAAAASIAEALGSAHRRGLVHRDVKPANILLTADGHPLLADFGLAAAGGSRLAGTAAYLDPAVAGGSEPGPASDVYALGVTCYEALAGALPFQGGSAEEMIAAASLGTAVPLAEAAPDADPALVSVVARAMDRQPRLRYPDGDALAAALRAASGQRQAIVASARAADSHRGLGSRASDRPDAAQAVQAAAPEVGDPRATRTFGPRPPRRVEDSRGRPPIPWLRVAAVAAFLLLAPPLVMTLGPARARAIAGAAAAEAGHTDAAPPGADAIAPPLPRTICAAPSPADSFIGWTAVGGDRCAAVHWTDGVLDVIGRDGASRRYALGEPGDQVLLGDWSCDGVDTPALMRAATGQLFVFPHWPDPDQPEIVGRLSERGNKQGLAVPSVERGGCDRRTAQAGEQP